MFERMTDRAKIVMKLAKEHARCKEHQFVGAEHILLGLARAGSGVGAAVLRNLGIDLHDITQVIRRVMSDGAEPVSIDKIRLSPIAKRVIEHAREEARNLNHNYVGTEHLLLGLLAERECMAAEVLGNLGVNSEQVREAVLELLGTPREGDKASNPSDSELARQEASGSEASLEDFINRFVHKYDPKVVALMKQKHNAIRDGDYERAAVSRDMALDIVTAKTQAIIQIITAEPDKESPGHDSPSNRPMTPRNLILAIIESNPHLKKRLSSILPEIRRICEQE